MSERLKSLYNNDTIHIYKTTYLKEFRYAF